ncbi:MAG: glycosyltransferase [Bacteroidales bacterium]|nr:glycosyltransferase [Bacteroidales bacterium]
MKRIYIYPNTKSRGIIEIDAGSPYMSFLRKELEKRYNLVNINDVTSSGIANLIKYINNTDILFLNWIENLPDKKLGFFQTLLFLILLFIFKLRKKKIIWVMHNKISHVRKGIRFKMKILKILLNTADLVITHSSEGITYAKNTFSVDAHNIKFIHHPLMKSIKTTNYNIEYDIIIWGKIWPYKGIHEFLEYLSVTDLIKKIRILLAGTIYPKEYHKTLRRYESDKVHFIDRFIPDDKLDVLIGKSKAILFTYKTDSLLSSAALMDSLVYTDKIIIGPNAGAFADLANENLVYTYNNFDELVELLRNIDKLKINADSLRRFCEENNWEQFGNKISEWMERV